MMYVDFNAGNKDYKLRLGMRDVVALEKKIGCNPVSIFGDGQDTVFPTMTTLAIVLHASMQKYHHGISVSDAQDILEEWFDEGNDLIKLTHLIMDVYKVSGLLPKDEEEVDSKNE